LDRLKEGGVEVRLVKGVTRFRVRYLEELEWNGGLEEDWRDEWEVGDLPVGMEVSIEARGIRGKCFVAIPQKG